jgi:hypothetical protein
MLNYRLYLLTRDGHITWAKDIDANSDETALELARMEDHKHNIEVWQGKRRVGIVEPA